MQIRFHFIPFSHEVAVFVYLYENRAHKVVCKLIEILILVCKVLAEREVDYCINVFIYDGVVKVCHHS